MDPYCLPKYGIVFQVRYYFFSVWPHCLTHCIKSQIVLHLICNKPLIRKAGLCLVWFLITSSNSLEVNFPKSDRNSMFQSLNLRISVSLKQISVKKKGFSISSPGSIWFGSKPWWCSRIVCSFIELMNQLLQNFLSIRRCPTPSATISAC